MLEHEHWLKIAKDDLKVAKLVLPEELFAPVTYHCQQAAEKALKGYLVFKKQQIIKTHDLAKLLENCLKFDRGFDKMYQAVRLLNPFSSKFRYPSEFDLPDLADAELAVKSAESVIKFVIKKFTEQETGQKNMFDSK